MPATGPEWTRRALLGTLAVTIAQAADPAEEAWLVVSDLAAALGRGSDTEFLSAFDSAAPGFTALRASVTALIAAAEVESSIDPVGNTGDGAARRVEVDWQMHLVDRTGLGRVTRRRETVTIRMEKRGRKWKVVGIAPAGFFSAPSA